MGFLSGVLGTKNKYKVTAPVNTYQATGNYQPAISAAQSQATGGAGPAQDTIRRQSALSDQLEAASRGEGPNPALEQLRQTTQANARAASGTAASARGINPAIAARMGVDAAAGANQQAAGQAATMSAQQQIAARQALGANLSATAGTQLGQQATGIQALGTAGGLQQGQQQINAQVAGQNAALDLGAQQLQAGIESGNAQANAGIVGGLLNGAGAAAGAGALSDERVKKDVHRSETREAVPGVPQATFRYKGEPEGAPKHVGVIAQDLEKKHPELVGRTADGLRTVPARPPFAYAQGGDVQDGAPPPPLYSYLDKLHAAQGLADGGGVAPAKPSAAATAGAGLSAFGKSMSKPEHDGFHDITAMHLSGMYANGGSIHSAQPVDALLSPGERVIPAAVAHSPSAPARAAHMVEDGEAAEVPGRAKVAGDSPKNDTVHARLEPGSIVIPRSVVNRKDAPRATASFVASVLKRSGGGRTPAATGNYAAGGLVAAPVPVSAPNSTPHTGRGLASATTRKRIKKASGPRPEAEE